MSTLVSFLGRHEHIIDGGIISMQREEGDPSWRVITLLKTFYVTLLVGRLQSYTPNES